MPWRLSQGTGGRNARNRIGVGQYDFSERYHIKQKQRSRWKEKKGNEHIIMFLSKQEIERASCSEQAQDAGVQMQSKVFLRPMN